MSTTTNGHNTESLPQPSINHITATDSNIPSRDHQATVTTPPSSTSLSSVIPIASVCSITSSDIAADVPEHRTNDTDVIINENSIDGEFGTTDKCERENVDKAIDQMISNFENTGNGMMGPPSIQSYNHQGMALNSPLTPNNLDAKIHSPMTAPPISPVNHPATPSPGATHQFQPVHSPINPISPHHNLISPHQRNMTPSPQNIMTPSPQNIMTPSPHSRPPSASSSSYNQVVSPHEAQMMNQSNQMHINPNGQYPMDQKSQHDAGYQHMSQQDQGQNGMMVNGEYYNGMLTGKEPYNPFSHTNVVGNNMQQHDHNQLQQQQQQYIYEQQQFQNQQFQQNRNPFQNF